MKKYKLMVDEAHERLAPCGDGLPVNVITKGQVVNGYETVSQNIVNYIKPETWVRVSNWYHLDTLGYIGAGRVYSSEGKVARWVEADKLEVAE